MANGIKEYKIVINGLQESINAVDSLNKQLDALEKRINSVSSAKVSAPTGGGSTRTTSNASALSEEERTQKEINKLKEQGAQLDAKIAASQDEIYKRVDATKQLYKETIADQKAIAAQERLTADAYSNTMVGMKQKLADIKQVMQTTDLGDTDKFSKLTKDANDLNSKLLEIEKSYGQFGRNVGQYSSAFEGLGKIKITVGDTVREFGSAREASRTLNEELKAMAINGQTDTKEFKELRQVVMELESTMKDVKSPMDAIMDGFQSIAAIASTTKGLSALFGFDDTEIEKSIQKLVALQNVMQGIDTINKQIQTREGVGKWIAPFTVQIDKATAKLLAFNTALLGTGKAASVAAKGIKLASTALKALASIGIVAVISIAIEKIMDLVESFNKLSDAEQAQKDAEEAMSKAYGEGQAKLIQYKTRLDSFNGSRKEEKKLVEELNKEFGTTLGTYKSLAEWQDVLKKKGEAYIQMLVKQAKVQAALNGVTAAYTKLMQVQMGIANGDYDGIWNKIFGKSGEARLVEAQREIEQMTEMLEESQKELENFSKDNQLGNYAPQINKNTAKTKNALEESQRTLNQLELRLMQEGLNKKLRQLDEEERQTIAKLQENGRKSAAEIQKIQKAYETLRLREIKDFIARLETSISEAANNIQNIEFGINDAKIKNQISELSNRFEKMSTDQPIRNTYISKFESEETKKLYNVDDNKIEFARSFENLFRTSEATKQADEYYKFLLNYIKDKDKELYQDISDYTEAIAKETDESRKQVYTKGLEESFGKAAEMVEKEYANELLYIRNYTQKIDQTLTDSFNYRINSEKEYDKVYRQQLMQNIAEQAKLNQELARSEVSAATETERERYDVQMSGLTAQKKLVEDGMKAIEKQYKVSGLEEIETIKETNKEVYEDYHDLFAKRVELEGLMDKAKKQHKDKQAQIEKEGEEKITKIAIDAAKDISSEQEKTFTNQIENLRDAQSKINELLNRQPVTNSLGIVDIPKTKQQYAEIETATKNMVNEIIAQNALLNLAFSKGLINPEAMNAIKNQLNDLESSFRELLGTVSTEAEQTIPKFVQSLQTYFNGVMDSFQTIMSAVWDAQDVAFDKEQEQLDKWNDELDKALDKQQNIIEQHKSSIDSIEDELATSRGDRRQHLIDQLNAEIEAQRRAQAEEERIQREKERAEKKQEELDLKRRKAEYKRNLTQAIVNGAMAVTMAAINKWPIPAIPMMALAASTTAAQIAIMASNKPYRVGGQLEGGLVRGKRHSEGGVPVGNTGIEVEGDEMIIRRESTMPNIDLLNYINKSQRKLNLSDFVEFYSNGKIKKNITSMNPKNRFASGGIINLPSDIDINDSLIRAFEDYSNRPVVVDVREITSKQENISRVQALAGLSND